MPKRTIPCVCCVCGVEFMGRADSLAPPSNRCCSHECVSAKGRAASALLDRSGQNNPGYKHGLSKVASRYTRAYERRYPGRVLAMRILHQAVRKGLLIRPECCEVCGFQGKVDAHHEVYTHPLKVRWLCRKCHNALHRARKKPAA